jgi:small subunit ribosomal protein S1|tara:strand:+ start:1724 stop:3697 length:1974 start_codon:yes stop_codon:yes gene_type:complete
MSKKESTDKKSDAENKEKIVKSETPVKKPRKRKVKESEKKSVLSDDNPVVIENASVEIDEVNLDAEPAKDLVKAPVIEEVFDWDKLANSDNYSDQERTDLKNTYSATLPEVEDKQVIDGKVVSISEREVIVDINFKSDGVISSSEFKYNEDLAVGDSVEVLVEQQEDKKGQLVLSHRRARVLRAWEKVNVALETGEVVNGQIRSRTKGGMIVDVFGIECFLPGSQIDVKPIRDYDDYVGKKMEFKVVKVNESFRNVVVSHKALIEADLAIQTKEIMSKLEKGQVIEGTVKNITSYGVFVDLGGIDGLIHITDLSWGRVSHPEEIVKLDETINVVILDFDEGKSRIQLGLKQLGSHPWHDLDENLAVGDVVKGKVVVVADYGVFVELQAGVEALLHVSEMSWSTHLRSANDFFSKGDSVEAKVLTLDREQRKMSLGKKQMLPDPWEKIEEKFPISSELKVKVRNFTNFGIFVELEEGVDGLVHISDLSWTKKIKHPAEFTSVDSMLDVVVLDIDQKNRKISLGHKQLESNPWDLHSEKYLVGEEFQGVLKEIYDKGALIDLNEEVEAFAPKRHLEKEDGSSVNLNDTVSFKVLEFSKENKKILVSHTATFKDNMINEKKKSASNTKKAMKKIQDSQHQSTLGDLDSLSALKDDLEKGE